METCENHTGKVVIVYETMGCPLCDAKAQIDTWEKQDVENSKKIETLEAQMAELEKRLAI